MGRDGARMKFRTLISRSLRFHARSHAWVAFGAAIGSMALTGALLVGDLIRGTLRERALQRLANASFALAPADRFFSQSLNRSFQNLYPWTNGGWGSLIPPKQGSSNDQPRFSSAVMLALPAVAVTPSGAARANHVQVFGLNESFDSLAGVTNLPHLSKDSVLLNAALASRLGAHQGDEVMLRVQRPSALPLEAAVNRRQDRTVLWRCACE